MESQPQNPEFRIILKTFTHAYNTVHSYGIQKKCYKAITLYHLINAHDNDIKCLSMSYFLNNAFMLFDVFFCGSFVFFVSCVSHAFTSVHCFLVVTCWERADLLALGGDVYCIFVTYPMRSPGSGVVLDCIVS